MKILEILRLLRDGHYEEFARAAIPQPALVFAVWQLLLRESEATCQALDVVCIPGVGVPVHCLDPQFATTIRTLLVPASAQANIHGENNSDFDTQAAAELKVCADLAKKTASQSAAMARDVLRLLVNGEMTYDSLPRKTPGSPGRDSNSRRQLEQADKPLQQVVIDGETIDIGSPGDPPEWKPLAETYLLTGAQVLSPSETGNAVAVLRAKDKLPKEERAKQIEVVLPAAEALRARTRLAMATAVPVDLVIRMEIRLADGKRSYRMEDIQMPADIREAVITLLEQADLFPARE